MQFGKLLAVEEFSRRIWFINEKSAAGDKGGIAFLTSLGNGRFRTVRESVI